MSVSAISKGNQDCDVVIRMLDQCLFLYNSTKVTSSIQLIINIKRGTLKYLDIFVPYQISELRNRTPSFLHEYNPYINLPFSYDVKSRDPVNQNCGEVILDDVDTNIREVSIEQIPYIESGLDATKIKIIFLEEITVPECVGIRLEFDTYSLNKIIFSDELKDYNSINVWYYIPRDIQLLNLPNILDVKCLITWLVFPNNTLNITNIAPQCTHVRPMDGSNWHDKSIYDVMEPFFYPRTKEIWGKLPRKLIEWRDKDDSGFVLGSNKYKNYSVDFETFKEDSQKKLFQKEKSSSFDFMSPSEKEKEKYFTNKFEFQIIGGSESGGMIVSGNKKIKIGHAELDLLVKLAKEVQKDYYGNDAIDIGWLKSTELRESVRSWRDKTLQDKAVSKKTSDPGEDIIKVISRLNIKLNNELGLEKKDYLIENGYKMYGRAGQFRLRVHPSSIEII